VIIPPSWCVIFCSLLWLGGTKWAVGAEPAAAAEPTPMRLMEIYGPRGRAIGDKNLEEVKILAGPEPAVMLNDRSPGRTWRAEIGGIVFRITIQDLAKLEVEELFDRIRRMPPAYRVVLPIVSEEGKAGLAVYADLQGAAAHGSQDYLNIIPKAGTRVLLHEAGHILEQRYRTAHGDVLQRWEALIPGDNISVSRYGDTVAHEDLAEFALVHALCLDSGEESLQALRLHSPRRFELWSDILKVAPQLEAPEKPDVRP
jgi:hypothetical protein